MPQEEAIGQIGTLAIGINNLTIAEIDTMFEFTVRFF